MSIQSASSLAVNDAVPSAKRQWRPEAGHTQVMAILNMTADSFSGDGLLNSDDPTEAIAVRARQAVEAGAHLLDVGAASTRPGAPEIPSDLEEARVAAALQAISHLDVPISVDTFNSDVAATALRCGATIINSVWGVRSPTGGWNEPMVELVSAARASIVLMHNRLAEPSHGPIGSHYKDVEYDDVVDAVYRDLVSQAEFATAHGIGETQLIIDPGIGFGKTPTQNVEILRNLRRFRELHFPILLSVSRKSVIGHILGKQVTERDEATAVLSALASFQGIDVVRVHDVQRSLDATRLVETLCR